MTSYIRGKVRRIISGTEVQLYLEEDWKAKRGMIFMVYEEGDDIRDPDGTFLGKFEIQKARIRITHVQPEFVLAESSEGARVYVGDDVSLQGMTEDDVYAPEPDFEWEWRPRVIATPPTPAKLDQEDVFLTSGKDVSKPEKLQSKRPRNLLVVVGDRVRSLIPVD